LLSIAYSTILVVYYIRTVALKMTGFPIIIAYRVKVVGFKMTSLTVVMIKLKNFLKRTIGVYIASKQTEYRLPSFRRRGLSSIGPLPLPYKILEPAAAIVKAISKTTTPLANFL